MLRKTVVLLIVLNLVYWFWASNWLAWLGLSSVPAGEPEFLGRQIHPEALRVRPLPPGAAFSRSTPAASNPEPASDANAQDKRRSEKP
jgi:hypothetical protein